MKRSSFLMLQFPSCCFRIFPSKSSMCDEEIGSENDNYNATFDAFRRRLERILSSDCLLPFPLSYSGLTAASGKIFKPDVARKHSVDDNPLGCSRRCLHSYSQSWKDIMSFDDILGNSYSELSMRCMRENKFKHNVNRLMTRIPEQVSQSFIKSEKWEEALESYENKIATKIRDLDGIIDDFWNDSSDPQKIKKRRRIEKTAETLKGKIPNDDAVLFTNVLQEHKNCIISKHELYLLPHRGWFHFVPFTSNKACLEHLIQLYSHKNCETTAEFID